MYKYGKELAARLGGVDITVTLFKCIRRDEIEKAHLHGLASVLGLLPTYKAYKDRDPFDEKVAVTLLSELLDKWYAESLFEAKNPREVILETLKKAKFERKVINEVEQSLQLFVDD